MGDKEFVWSEDFLRPLVVGGTCFVGNPLGQSFVRQALRVTHEQVFEEIKPHLLRAYAKWLPEAPVPFDNEFGLLTAALYELCATAHPQTDAFYAQAHDFAAHAQVQVQGLSAPNKAVRFVMRHLAVAPLLALTRKAIEVQWWSGQKTFFGESPDRHLLWLPKLRKVRVDEKQQPFWSAAWRSGDEVNRNARRNLLKTLLLKSPLTSMVAAVSDLPLTRFDINPLLRSKSNAYATGFLMWEDPTLARGLMDVWLGENAQKAGHTLAFWFLSALERQSAHRHAQQRCLEILMYLLWSTLMMDKPQQERQTLWEFDFWDSDPKSWPEERLMKWSLIAWALLETELSAPFTDLNVQGRRLIEKLLLRLQHKEIQTRMHGIENQLQAVWKGRGASQLKDHGE